MQVIPYISFIKKMSDTVGDKTVSHLVRSDYSPILNTFSQHSCGERPDGDFLPNKTCISGKGVKSSEQLGASLAEQVG